MRELRYTNFFVIKYEGRRPLERLVYAWEDNGKMYVEEVGSDSMDLIQLVRIQW
jgi:hypothetical protein